ncbi:hypothetical protein D3C87_302990 [compost metagenome]
MTRPQQKLYPVLLASALLLSQVAASAADAPTAPPSPPTVLAAPQEGMPQYGQGEHGMVLTLTLHNNRDSAIAPNTPYRLFLTGAGQSIDNTPSQDGIVHGVTDAQGRTAWIWTREPHSAQDFTLIRRIGDGPWGQFFQLGSRNDSTPLPGWPYVTTMHKRWGEQWVDLGYTNDQGGTAYFSHDEPAGSLSLSVDAAVTDNRACFDELDAINRKFSQGDEAGARRLIDGMQCAESPQQLLDAAHLMLMAGKDAWAREFLARSRLWRFPQSLRPTEDGVLRSRLKLEKLLGMPELALADAVILQNRQARQHRAARVDGEDLANGIAYYLADFPGYLPQAEEQARNSIQTRGSRPYNQGTLGWILALRGDTAGGLRLMKQAYRDIPRDEEMVADYGLALWRDGQRDLAARLWDQAQTQCVWGQRMHSALREAGYPHPYFEPTASPAVDAYRKRCDQPRTKRKTLAASPALIP